MKKRRLCWAPTWPGVTEAWSRKFMRQNQWRVDWLHSLDDLMQDAYLIFLHVAKTYPNVHQPGHFMALFKRAMQNKMHDRSLRKRSHVELEAVDGRIGDMTNSGYLHALLADAPQEVKMALEVIGQNPAELHEGRLNTQLRHILGFDRMRLHKHTQFDLAEALTALLD